MKKGSCIPLTMKEVYNCIRFYNLVQLLACTQYCSLAAGNTTTTRRYNDENFSPLKYHLVYSLSLGVYFNVGNSSTI